MTQALEKNKRKGCIPKKARMQPFFVYDKTAATALTYKELTSSVKKLGSGFEYSKGNPPVLKQNLINYILLSANLQLQTSRF